MGSIMLFYKVLSLFWGCTRTLRLSDNKGLLLLLQIKSLICLLIRLLSGNVIVFFLGGGGLGWLNHVLDRMSTTA